MHFMHLYVKSVKLWEDVLFSKFQLASDCRNALISDRTFLKKRNQFLQPS